MTPNPIPETFQFKLILYIFPKPKITGVGLFNHNLNFKQQVEQKKNQHDNLQFFKPHTILL